MKQNDIEQLLTEQRQNVSHILEEAPVDVVWNVNISGRKLDHFFRWSNFVVRVGIDFVQFRGQAVGHVLIIRSDIQLQGTFKEFKTWQMLDCTGD